MPANDAIKYSFDRLDQCSGKLGNVARAVDEIRNNLDSLKNAVDSHWQGNAQNAYAERAEILLSRLNNLYEEVSDNKKRLDFAIRTQREHEESLTSDVNSKLSDDNIF